MKFLDTFNKKVLEWEENITCLFLFSITSLVFLAAILRAFGLPQAWMSDLSQLLFGWVIFLGSDIALAYKRHIGVEFFEEKLPSIIKIIIKKTWSIFIIAFLGFLTYYGWFLTQKSRRKFDSLVVSEYQLVIFLTCIALLFLFIDFLRNGKKHIKIYLSFFIVIIAIGATCLITFDLVKDPKPISYSFLIVSVPVGCLLMIRTELISFIMQWSKNND